MEPWELTDDEIKALRGERGYVKNYVDPLDRAIATAAGKKARKDLAKDFMRRLQDDPVASIMPSIISRFDRWLKGQGL